MKNHPLISRFVWLLLVLAVLALAGTGCTTTEAENTSSRPWNAQKGWENGFPSRMNEGR
jgi:hypothetical protein